MLCKFNFQMMQSTWDENDRNWESQPDRFKEKIMNENFYVPGRVVLQDQEKSWWHVPALCFETYLPLWCATFTFIPTNDFFVQKKQNYQTTSRDHSLARSDWSMVSGSHRSCNNMRHTHDHPVTIFGGNFHLWSLVLNISKRSKFVAYLSLNISNVVGLCYLPN